MSWSPERFHSHNLRLSPSQSDHGARIANAILRDGGSEGIALATANKYFQRHDVGGIVDPTSGGVGGVTPSNQTANPMTQGMIQRYASLPPERLQELSVMMGGTPQGQIIQRILQQKRTQPNAAPVQQQRGGKTPRRDGTVSGCADGGLVSRVIDPPRPEKTIDVDKAAKEYRRGQGTWVDRLLEGGTQTDLNLPIIDPSSGTTDRGEYGSWPVKSLAPKPSEMALLRGGRAPRRDIGGGMMSIGTADPAWARSDSRQETSGAGATGYLHGTTSGRADAILTTAPAGSYVIPADVVAGLGEGNSLAGAKVMDQIIRTGPRGIQMQRGASVSHGPPRAPAPFHESKGGPVGDGARQEQTPVALSHGEFVVPLEHVKHWGGGDLTKGHKVFDEFVVRMRKHIIEQMKKLPGPVKSKAA